MNQEFVQAEIGKADASPLSIRLINIVIAFNIIIATALMTAGMLLWVA